MSLFAFLIAAASAAPLQFAFVGQPECVSLSYADGLTQLQNDCPDPLLLDHSVQLDVMGQRGGLVPARTTTQIRDLSAFTLGMNGKLFRVVAVLSEPIQQAEVPDDVTDTGP